MSAEPRSNPLDCNCLTVRQAARQVTQFYDRYLAQVGLRATQFSILAMLNGKGPIAINALAAELVMDRTTLGRNIRPLERDGLLTIKTSAADRRTKELHLTAAGKARLRIAQKGWAEAQTRFEAAFGRRRAADLRALLREVVRSAIALTAD